MKTSLKLACSCLTLMTVAASVSLVYAQVPMQETVGDDSRYVAQSAYASYEEYREDGSTVLNVYQDISGQAESTFIQLYQSSCVVTDSKYHCAGVVVFADIRSKGFEVDGMDQAYLSTDLPEGAGYTYEYGCSLEMFMCEFKDAPFLGGHVEMSFSKSSFNTFRYEGTSNTNLLNFRFEKRGSFVSSSASVKGEILGVEVYGDGSVGMARDVSIRMFKQQ